MKLNIEELQNLKSEGYVRCAYHDFLPLIVWNYTPKAQYDKAWETYPILLECRGLVLDIGGSIIARGFKKFFNRSELDPSKRIDFNDKIEITQKLDGSLLIVFRYNDQVVSCTRGSFNSTQNALGFFILKEKGYDSLILPDKTFLFEICGPDNRIVVSYPENDLTLLGIIDNNTGEELSRDDNFKTVKVYEFDEGMKTEGFFETLAAFNTDNEEGFVIRRISDNHREKIKFSSYCALHRIVTGMSSVHIWEYLKDNKTFEEILEICPDEFNSWLSITKNNLLTQYADLEAEAMIAFDNVKNLPSRKDQAIELNSKYSNVSHIVFKMLSDIPYSELIWKQIKPQYSQRS